MASSDFDFLHGDWEVEHDKLVDPFGPADGPRANFRSTASVQPILNGLGNADQTQGTLSDGTDFAGYSLRLYDPASDEWVIWWASTSRPGVLDDPVRGRFVDGVGTFVGPAEVDGRQFLARFHWVGTDGPHPVWQQDFSFDDGATWQPINWRMVHTRAQ